MMDQTITPWPPMLFSSSASLESTTPMDELALPHFSTHIHATRMTVLCTSDGTQVRTVSIPDREAVRLDVRPVRVLEPCHAPYSSSRDTDTETRSLHVLVRGLGGASAAAAPAP